MSNIIGVDGHPLTTSIKKAHPQEDILALLGGGTSKASVNPTTAMKHGTVYACIRILAEGLGQLPVRLYEVDEDNKKTLTKRGHKSHKVMTLAPNDYMTWQELIEMYVLHISLRGKFFCLVNRDILDNNVLEFIPIPNPDSVAVTLVNGKRSFKIDCPELGIKGTYGSDKILHIKSLTENGLEGLSTIAQTASTINLARQAEGYATEFYDNDATPNVIIETDKALDAGGQKRLRESLKGSDALTSSKNIGVLEQGMKIRQLSINQKDAQFLETRAFQDTQICTFFRVPPVMLGLGDNKYGSAEQLRLSFTSDALNPLIVRLQETLKVFLYEDNLEIGLDLSGFLRGDLATTSAYLEKMFKMGAFTINDVRSFVGEDEVDGGDKRVIQTNNTVLGVLTDTVEGQNNE